MEANEYSADWESGDGSLGTLIERLGQVLGSPPQDAEERAARSLEARLLMSGIEELGVDASALVRYGMTQLAWLPVFVLLIVTPESQRTCTHLALDFDGWLRVLNLGQLPLQQSNELDAFSGSEDLSQDEALHEFMTTGVMAQTIERAMAVLPRWVKTASIADLLDLAPPTEADMREVTLGGPPEDVEEAYRWLWDRFGVEDFDTWTDSSLRLEFRWREEELQPMFPVEEMQLDRDTDRDLHRELARRYVRGESHDPGNGLLGQLQQQALGFLQQGRHAEAAALFEFYLRRVPDDSMARNNLAFCLMPKEPETALHNLQRIRPESSRIPTIVVHNLCTTLAILGRHAEALDQAEYHWQRGREKYSSSAHLWRLTGDGLELFYATHLDQAFAELGFRLAEALENPDRMERWKDRVASTKGATDRL